MIHIRAQLIDQMTRHAQFLRSTLVRNPSEETINMWRLEDQQREIIRNHCAKREQKEADENITFDFSSEVKIK